MTSLEKISHAGQAGQLLPGAVANLTVWLNGGLPAWAQHRLIGMIERGEWSDCENHERSPEASEAGIRRKGGNQGQDD